MGARAVVFGSKLKATAARSLAHAVTLVAATATEDVLTRASVFGQRARASR